jgi:hypothetical protein
VLWIRIRIQHVNWIRIRIQGFNDQNLRKIYSWNFLISFLEKNCNLLIRRPSKRMSKLQDKPSALKRKHPAQKMKFIINFFSIFVGHFCLLDPNPIRSRICILIHNTGTRFVWILRYGIRRRYYCFAWLATKRLHKTEKQSRCFFLK